MLGNFRENSLIIINNYTVCILKCIPNIVLKQQQKHKYLIIKKKTIRVRF